MNYVNQFIPCSVCGGSTGKVCVCIGREVEMNEQTEKVTIEVVAQKLRAGKTVHYAISVYKALHEMSEGETIALSGLNGTRIFKLVELKPPHKGAINREKVC